MGLETGGLFLESIGGFLAIGRGALVRVPVGEVAYSLISSRSSARSAFIIAFFLV